METVQSCMLERLTEFETPLEINDNNRKGEIGKKLLILGIILKFIFKIIFKKGDLGESSEGSS